ncbi:PAAR domain-containing protein [Tenacibaculum maritimum]|uniref:PAAR domain-containing protein n=1 Tax=Tenacibaculum maritimum TaxID=107401 RepID=UPI0012E6B830|nr:PAAR domain-containing protein [Tenacibaculum maritimum]MCD9564022.1 PAAR domain-containing protein [Tenacibaculum maritimum]MCD9564401.1 PAAR domain-containing protein [Tenacibaculum maritimum]MCD9578247.1 PAAR domain-containing protein [Tenacibaculum maritimum]MCD9598035.1 PAAR domain-containing protein [Tenacibaculum maritimum]MCD9614961.1 PAAR domain-containing protein [Tenacibaculum maritimum]
MPGPVATEGSMHVCPMCSGKTPHVGGPISQGEPNILINEKPAATQGSMCICTGPPDMVAQGDSFVFFNGKPVACVGDMTAHGGVITSGESNVLISNASTTPSVTMPRKRIPFPEITFTDRILAKASGNGKKLKEAEANQEKLKEETTGTPRIYNLQWLKEEKIIRKSKVLKEVTLKANVANIADGETISFAIKKPMVTKNKDGEITEKEEEIITLKGIVEDHTVTVTWEVADATQDQEETR